MGAKGDGGRGWGRGCGYILSSVNLIHKDRGNHVLHAIGAEPLTMHVVIVKADEGMEGSREAIVVAAYKFKCLAKTNIEDLQLAQIDEHQAKKQTTNKIMPKMLPGSLS